MKAELRDRGSSSQPSRRTIAAAFMFASLGVFLLNTRHGIGILPDSVSYMQLGVSRHFAPLYTWILLGASSLGTDIIAAAKWLGFVLVALNTFLIWRLLSAATGSARYAAIGTALVVCNPVFVRMHAVAMTEPLFLLLFLVAVAAFVQGLDDRRSFWFLIAGGAVGFAMLARFAAAPLLPALGMVRLLCPGRPLGQRIGDCLQMGLAAGLVFGTWMVASELVAGESTGRAFAFRGDPDAAFWWGSLQSASIMLLPSPVPPAIRIPFLAVSVAVALWAAISSWRRRRPTLEDAPSPRHAVSSVLGFFALFYTGFLLLSVYVQFYLPLNGRMLLPLYVAVVLATAIVVARLREGERRSRSMRVVLAFVTVTILAANLARTVTATASAFSSGVGYASQVWAMSPSLRAVSKLPPDSAIYSNAPDLITFRLGRHAEYLPRKINPLTGVEDPDRSYLKQLDKLEEGLSRGDAYVAFVDAVDWRYYLATEQKLVANFDLVKVLDAADGRIYRSRRKD